MPDFRMPDINAVQIAGRLTRDPELRYLPSGMAVCKMGLAVSRFYKSKDGEKREETMFINVTVWGKTAEYANEYLRKGRPVHITGALRANEFEDKTGQKRTIIEINADRVQQLDWGEASKGTSTTTKQREPEPALPPADDDIPF